MVSKMKKIIFSVFFTGFCFAALAQQTLNVYWSGNYIDTPFKDFILEVEMKTSLKFYYQRDWVKDVTINISGSDVDLIPAMRDQLKKAGLNIYVESNNIYIYPGDQIVTELPFFKIPEVEKKDTLPQIIITQTERKYLEGQKVAPVKVLEIGDRKKGPDLSRCIINGRIIDESNSEPLIGATVYVEELKTGAVADLEGRFKLALLPGKYKASFSYMSMKKQDYYLQVYSSGSVIVKMKQELIALKEVRVTSNRYDNVKGMQMGFEKISVKAIKEIPIAFGERDVLKVVQMLPGVLNVGEGSSGFNVRGSAEDQNMFYIDKIPVYNTSHLFGFFTSFNPDIISDFSFYKSNIPAIYGGRLSSVFDIKTRQGNKKKLFFQGGISPITGHGSVEIPVIKDKVSVVTSFRSSYSDWILKMIRDKDLRKSSAYFNDGSFSVNAEINDKNLLKAFVYLSRDKFSLSSLNDYDYSNTGSSLSWKHIVSPSISSDFAVIFSRYSYENVDKSILSTAYKQNYRINHYETRQDFSILTGGDHKIELGASEIYYNLDRGNISPYGEQSNRIPFSHGKERGVEMALYISDEFSLFRDLTVSTGLRYSIFGQFGPANINIYDSGNIRTIDNIKETRVYHEGDLIKSYSGPEYRFSLNYGIGNNSSVKASYNRLYQYIFMIRNAIAVSPDDKWKLCDYHIKPPVADQVSVGYYRDFNEGGIKASLELYHKWVKNQVGFKDGSDFASYNPIETQVLQGKQRVDGIEFMLRKNTGRATGWVSYCYSRSFIRVDGGISENQINNGIEYPSDYDRPHSFNLVFNYRTNRRLSFSSNFVYTTGRPMTCPVSVYYSEGQQLLNFSRRNEYRIPDYVRLDVSVNIEGNLLKKKPLHGSWSLSGYNVLGRKNAYSVFFDEENGRVHGHKLAIFGIPVITLSWICKFGNYLND
jgi:hypothetical protein